MKGEGAYFIQDRRNINVRLYKFRTLLKLRVNSIQIEIRYLHLKTVEGKKSDKGNLHRATHDGA